MKDNVLVTGAAGFIGRYVVDALLQEGYEVTALVRKKPKQFDDRVVVVEADICKEDIEQRTKGLVKKCGTLIHLAADLDMRGSDQTILTNCLGTYHVAGLAKAIGVKRFVYLSSIPVIGVPKDLPITELHPIEPKTLYHITKYAGEQIVRQELSESIQTVILRIPSPIGKGMNPNFYLPFLLRKCQKNETIELYGEGKRSQNYIDVRDIASAVLCSISSEKSGLYLIAGKKEITNQKLAFLCRKITGSVSEIVWGRREDPEEENQWVISGEKARKELGFIPRYELAETIRWMIYSLEKSE